MSGQKSTHVSEEKKKIVAEFKDLISKKKTILLASIKNLPASQFQEIGKKLRGKAIVKVPKKNLIFRAIDDSGNEAVKELEKHITRDVAILFSDIDAFELAGELIASKSPAKAKPGQIAPADIEIQAGPTDLPPGPAISELGAVGLQVQIENGKIKIRESKVIVKEGQEISQAAADVMAKLDIKPFSVGFVPISAFDLENKKFYAEIKIDREETLEKLKEAHGRALPFAVDLGYTSPDTISFLLGKASGHAKTLKSLNPAEPEKVEAPKEEEKKEEAGEKPKEDTQTPETKPEEVPVEEAKPEESSGEEK
jgi:large subunit ribosomal protein L10